uniref:Uncharacterized protein n=1 Tax=Clastoptera arizonana TaxID=38151 RepID=A0A1B6D017_9HEMI
MYIFLFYYLVTSSKNTYILYVEIKFVCENNYNFHTLSLIFRDLVAELPFILMHPKPEDEPQALPGRDSPSKATTDSVPVDTNLIQLDADTSNGLVDPDDDIIFEDFARLRLKAGESEA